MSAAPSVRDDAAQPVPRRSSEIDVSTVEGPWRFTREVAVDRAESERFYDLYTLAFDPLKSRSVARQVLTREEFFGQMTDEFVDKYVAWDEAGEAVGITTLTKHLASIPWISPEYFAAQYPDAWSRNAVYYLGFTLTHPRLRRQRFLETIIRVGVAALVTEHAVLAYDVCAYNNTALRFSERIEEALSGYPQAHVEIIDTQIYYAVEFV